MAKLGYGFPRFSPVFSAWAVEVLCKRCKKEDQSESERLFSEEPASSDENSTKVLGGVPLAWSGAGRLFHICTAHTVTAVLSLILFYIRPVGTVRPRTACNRSVKWPELHTVWPIRKSELLGCPGKQPDGSAKPRKTPGRHVASWCYVAIAGDRVVNPQRARVASGVVAKVRYGFPLFSPGFLESGCGSPV